jgi:hypothetical protein
MMTKLSARRGVAIMWALVILTVLTLVSATAVWQMSAGRRAIDHRQSLIQALWLARSGAELAADRLLADANYVGETSAIAPETELRIVVTQDGDAKESYRIRCEARVPASGPGSTAKVLSWKATRHGEPVRVRLEIDDSEKLEPSPQS